MAHTTASPLAGSTVQPSSSMHASRGAQAVIAVLFVALISLPLAANILGRDGGDPQAENRELAPFPSISWSVASIAAFPNAFGHWFEDHFGFRAALVRWNGALKLYGLRVSPSTTVIAGKNGWLFYAEDGALDDYTAEKPMPPAEIEGWRETITRADRFVKAHGGRYVFTIPPDKHVIYPEQMPDSIRRIGDVRRMDQVFQVLQPTGVAAVDVRPALEAAKARERIYEQTDTHWNDRGALVAYQQIIEAVRRQNPAVPPAWSRHDFEPVSRVVRGEDLAGMLGLTRVLRETELSLTPRRPRHAVVVEPPGAEPTAEEGRLVTEIPGSTLPRAVIFRDSFFSRLVPFTSEHFSRAVYLWQNDFDPDVVVKEHADVVIQEIVGRHLYGYMPSPELIPR